jgi:hypothetical protein
VEFPPEPLATCSRCAMGPGTREDSDGIEFSAPARCCTYHPRLPNFTVGRILRRGGVGADRVRARITARLGIHPIGLWPPASWRRTWEKGPSDAFGRDPALTCPFWVDGAELACSIHPEREAVCRTWHCKVAGGLRSREAWGALQATLARIERTLAEWCVRAVPEDPDPERFYLACADRVDRLTDDEVQALRTAGLTTLLDQLRDRVDERDAPMPDVLQPRIAHWWPREGAIALASSSSLDREPAPPWIFELLSRMDGVRPSREAVAETEAAIGAPVEEALVRRLWARGLLGPPIHADRPVTVSLTFVPGDVG